ncbi:putative outer membrane efflux protein [Caenibius tardaugens NBRC 16725]|uniref:Putative outer membrane efflux protein n=1 Tax=Caenibius tardaugens NBRC 16725 TaxID=1219035 RepID=U2ZZ14_9SPHN|nr:efflux transporter outer membrane subunit [Caenibius tardaugens]AZI37017.1 efflux transporter outer membrane subunit [Caenibius tardaugens NBRC 16725]GAD47758.1 putative outer membrane efflux protein [Caenibius tardaugens NBRC 16725]
MRARAPASHASWLLPLLLAGCAGPHVETAQLAPLTPPAQWRVDPGATAPLERAWWQAFGDPVLTELVTHALANNLDIAIAGTRVRDAKAQEMAARAALLPTLDAVASGADSRSLNAFGQPTEQTAAQPQVQAAWEIDLFGRLSDTRSAARSAWLASEAARDSVRLSIASAVASGYINLLALDARLQTAQQTLTARAQTLRLIQRREAAGYSPKLERMQAEAEYQAAAQIIPPLEQAIAQQENGLKLLTGELPGAIARGGTLATLTEPAIPDGLPSELLRRRPDVTQAEWQLAAADSSLSAARKRFLPQLRLNGSAGAVVSTLLGDPISIWSIGGSILAPLFEGGRLRAGAESTGAQRDSAAFAYRKTALNAFREVNDALVAAQQADRQLAILVKQRDALAESYRLATNRYKEGYSPYLEQLDAQRGLLSAELALIQARANAMQARVTLYQVMGGGWSADMIAQAHQAAAIPQGVTP